MSQRIDVWELDRGRCVNCRERLQRGADLWQWHVHHCIKEQTLRARKVPRRVIRGTGICVLLCRRCHERHTSWTAVIPLDRLPERIMRTARELGPWAEDLLLRNHPP